jgi:hypothetical protein
MLDSRLNNWYPVALIEGRIIIRMTIIPIPPIQWVRLLQKRIEYGRISTSFSTEAPVVEKPEVDSKKASINGGIAPLKIYGREPSTEKKTHDRVTDRKPSLLLNLEGSAFLDMV